jgi:trehalose-phosphatase
LKLRLSGNSATLLGHLHQENDNQGTTMTRYLFDDMWSVGEQIARAQTVLLCAEFDGALAAIVDDDALVSLSPQMQRVLWSLADQEKCRLAFLSHRSRFELQARIGLPDVWYVGCHGLEISGPGHVSVHPAAEVYSRQLQPVAAKINELLRPFPELTCEDRGLTLRISLGSQPVSVSEQVTGQVQELARRLAPTCRVAVEEDVLELRPAVSWNRASAMRLIEQQLAPRGPLLVYVGGGDEETFLSLDDAITLRVGECDRSAAQYYVAGPPDVRRFLEWVAGLGREQRSLVGSGARAGLA